jgi:hypothetical protein
MTIAQIDVLLQSNDAVEVLQKLEEKGCTLHLSTKKGQNSSFKDTKVELELSYEAAGGKPAQKTVHVVRLFNDGTWTMSGRVDV